MIGLVFILGEILFIPRSILAAGSGLIIKEAFQDMNTTLLYGLPLICAAAFVSSIIQFGLGRYIFKDCTASIKTRYKVIGAMLNQMEITFSTMTLIHMVPFVPMNFISFTAGISAMDFGHYLLACFGIVPGTSLFFVLGANFSEILEYINRSNDVGEEHKKLEITRLILVVFATVVLAMLLIWCVKVYDALQTSKKYEATANSASISNYHQKFMDPESKTLLKKETIKEASEKIAK
jgi:uncharacterized membrane protein YdjX (TVP38/TMEM64 family)